MVALVRSRLRPSTRWFLKYPGEQDWSRISGGGVTRLVNWTSVRIPLAMVTVAVRVPTLNVPLPGPLTGTIAMDASSVPGFSVSTMLITEPAGRPLVAPVAGGTKTHWPTGTEMDVVPGTPPMANVKLPVTAAGPVAGVLNLQTFRNPGGTARLVNWISVRTPLAMVTVAVRVGTLKVPLPGPLTGTIAMDASSVPGFSVSTMLITEPA